MARWLRRLFVGFNSNMMQILLPSLAYLTVVVTLIILSRSLVQVHIIWNLSSDFDMRIASWWILEWHHILEGKTVTEIKGPITSLEEYIPSDAGK